MNYSILAMLVFRRPLFASSHMNPTLSTIEPTAESTIIPALSLGASTPGLRLFSKIFSCVVGGLILMGALVTSHDAGLAVPDWPTSYGENMFLYPPSKWKGIIFYEHFHRLYASVVGMLTVVLVVWTVLVEKRRWVKIFTGTALAAVIVQGLLGGLTVLYRLPTAVSSAHGVLGQTFFVCSLIIAYSHSLELGALRQAAYPPLVRTFVRQHYSWAFFIVGMVYTQLIIAAVMRHSGAGLAFVDFPTHAGRWIPTFTQEVLDKANQLRALYHLPPVESFHLFFHALHRVMAYLILAAVYHLSWRVTKSPECPAILKSSVFIMTVIVSLQLMLGIATVASIRSPWVTSIHVLGGALLLAFSVFFTLRVWAILNPIATKEDSGNK